MKVWFKNLDIKNIIIIIVITIVTFASIMYILDSHKTRQASNSKYHYKHKKKNTYHRQTLEEKAELTKEEAIDIIEEAYPDTTIVKNYLKELDGKMVYCVTIKDNNQTRYLLIDANDGTILDNTTEKRN